MIRATLLWMLVAFLAAYAWRDWYKSLCGLILLIAVVEHPDFPKSMMGVQGLNPWNILLVVVIAAWASSRGREGLKWDMPRNLKNLLVIYFLIVCISFTRLLFDLDPLNQMAAEYDLPPASVLTYFSEHIINCIKWVIPGLLLFDGCRSEQRFRLATYCVVGVYLLLAIQVIRWMPISTLASGSDLEARSMKILANEIGYHRVNMAMLLAGGSWALFCARVLPNSRLLFNVAVFFSAVTFFGVALTGGRMGFATWGAIALILGAFKWKKVVVLAPLALALVVTLVPAVRERMMQGFTADTIDTNVNIESLAYDDGEGPHLYTVTAGRTFAWQFVLEEITKAPFLGYGREGMKRTGVTVLLYSEYGELFGHPHNAYLEWILDNGIIGLIPIFLFYYVIVKIAITLFRDQSSKYSVAIGGVALSLVLALLIAAMGSQTFYPREGAVGMWCAIGLALRVYVQREHLQRALRNGQRSVVEADFWRLKSDRNPYRRYRYG
jgi:O-antigen ligase